MVNAITTTTTTTTDGFPSITNTVVGIETKNQLYQFTSGFASYMENAGVPSILPNTARFTSDFLGNSLGAGLDVVFKKTGESTLQAFVTSVGGSALGDVGAAGMSSPQSLVQS